MDHATYDCLVRMGSSEMKRYHYMPAFNAKIYGAAEARADRYWKRRLAEIKNKKERPIRRW